MRGAGFHHANQMTTNLNNDFNQMRDQITEAVEAMNALTMTQGFPLPPEPPAAPSMNATIDPIFSLFSKI